MNLFRFFAALASVAVLVLGVTTACAGDDSALSPPTAAPGLSGEPSASLRSDLDRLLSEHVYLATAATAAALGGRAAEYTAAATALDANSVDLAKTWAVYGAEAGQAVLDGWRQHIGFFVLYTQGAAANDAGTKSEAVAGLERYAQHLADWMNEANGMAKADVVSFVSAHAAALIAVIDAQAAGDEARAFQGTRVAALHMQLLADQLTEATVRKFPEQFRPG